MNVGRINRLQNLYNTNNVYNANSVSGSGAIGPSVADPRTGSASTARGALVPPPAEDARLRDHLAAVFTSADGDSAEISKKAMQLWRDLATGTDASLTEPFSQQTILSLPFDHDLNLPSPFLNWEEIINNSEPPPVLRYAPAPDTAPPAVTPSNAEPPSAAAPGITPPGTVSPSPPGSAGSGIDLPGTEIGSIKFDTIEPRGECKTCESRRYVDQSDDPSVSFQTPTKVNPNMAMGAVTSHENEHVRNEQSKAQREGREIVNQTVTLTYDTCPECGRNYVSGGTTRTTSISRHDSGDGQGAAKDPEGSDPRNGS